jgi:hypothetical protein
MEKNKQLKVVSTGKYIKVNGKWVKLKWEPEPEWESLYKKIKYYGNPMDKKIQMRVHKIFNSLSKEDQKEWLEKTGGYGWSDEYIKIALTFWDKQGDYIIRDKELVREYMSTLTKEEKDNFNDICNVFCSDDHYIHIKNSCGFLEYLENKEKIEKYITSLTQEDRDNIEHDLDGLVWTERYHKLMKEMSTDKK